MLWTDRGGSVDRLELHQQMSTICQRMIDSLGLAANSLLLGQGWLEVCTPPVEDSLGACERVLYRQIREFHFQLTECICCYRTQTEFFVRLVQDACEELQKSCAADAQEIADVSLLHRRFSILEQLVLVHLAQISLIRDSLRVSSQILRSLFCHAVLTYGAVRGSKDSLTDLSGELDRVAKDYALLLEIAVESLAEGDFALSACTLQEAEVLLRRFLTRANGQKAQILQGVGPDSVAEYVQIVLLHSGCLDVARLSELVPQA